MKKLRQWSQRHKAQVRVILFAVIALGLIFSWSISASIGGNSDEASKKVAPTPGPQPQAFQSGAQPSPAADEPEYEKPHTLAASFYRLDDTLETMLTLNHKGAKPLEVRPTLYNLAGEQFAAPAIVVGASSHRVIDMKEWLPLAGESFAQGSLKLYYRGKDLQLGAQVKIADPQASLIFDEQLVEYAGKFASSRLEGVWRLGTPDAQMSLLLSNTSDATLSVETALTGIFLQDKDPAAIQLLPHETKVLRLPEELPGSPVGKLAEVGGISLRHSGAPGDLLARATIQDAAKGFSSAVNFVDPSMNKSSELHGAGLRLGRVGDDTMIPMVVARNVGDSPALLSGRIIFTSSDNNKDALSIGETRLMPGEVRAVDMSKVVLHAERSDIATAGLEFEYDTKPGSVILSALSVSQGGNLVFHVPLLDPAALMSSTGGYPWQAAGDLSTLVYIKNVSDKTQQYVAHLSFPDGEYMIGLKSIGPGETISYDIGALRDNQTPDEKDRTIPPSATGGQFKWGLMQDEEGSPRVLIGRAEQVSIEKAISSTYACQNCCTSTYHDAFLQPGGAESPVNGQIQYEAYQTNLDCYGLPYTFRRTNVSWSSNNQSIATINGSGLATAKSGGNATITGSWNTINYLAPIQPCGGPYRPEQPNLPDPCSCTSHASQITARSPLLVVPTVEITEVGFTNDYRITRWTDGVAIDNPDGSAPTWKKTNNPNHPVAYTRGTMPTMFAKLTITPALTTNMTATIYVRRGADLIATKTNVTLSGSQVQVTGITTSVALENSTKSDSYGFNWEVFFSGGALSYPIGLSGPHLFHWTYATPVSPPFQNDAGQVFTGLYDKAFEEAAGHANGGFSLGEVINNINQGVDGDIFYNPTRSIGASHPLAAYLSPDGCQCSDLANLLRGLLRTIGINGTTLYIWAGPNASTLRKYRVGSTGSTNPTFRILRAANDGAPQNPHFSFHSVVSTSGTWYDPSYGLTYSSLPFDETAFNSTPQQVSTSLGGSVEVSGWFCPH